MFYIEDDENLTTCCLRVIKQKLDKRNLDKEKLDKRELDEQKLNK